MNETVREDRDQLNPTFSAPFETDGVTLITATRNRLPARTLAGSGPHSGSGDRPEPVGTRPMGAFVIQNGTARWHPAVDVTRLLTTAEIVAGAVLVARILARRPGTPKAQVTMGPGGWVSMKGGSLEVRPARRPWGRPRPIAATKPDDRAPLWARVLSAVPLQTLIR